MNITLFLNNWYIWRVPVNRSRYLVVLVLIVLLPAGFFGCSTAPGDGTDPFPSSVLLASSAVTAGGGWAAVSTGIVFTLSIGMMPGGPGVFDSLVLTPENTGTTYRIVSSDDEDFLTVVDSFTNGADDFLTFQYDGYPSEGGGAGGSTESGFFLGGVTGEYLPDFTGLQIDYFTLTINTLTLDSPGSDPNEDGNWTDYDIELQIKVYGHAL